MTPDPYRLQKREAPEGASLFYSLYNTGGDYMFMPPSTWIT